MARPGSDRRIVTSGYSQTPLVRKLGIAQGARVGVVGDPGHLAGLLDPLPRGARLIRNPRASCPVTVAFAPTTKRFRNVFPRLLSRLPADGALWIAWPKKSSPLHVDLTEDAIRAAALQVGLVDNKVCALDSDWSGLRLVVRRENRDVWNAEASPTGGTTSPG